MATSKPQLSPLVRIMFIVVALVLVAGVSLLIAPSLVGPRWPWALRPFATRFLGAVYAAEMVAVLFTLVINDWSVARLTIPQAVTFTTVVTGASLVWINNFDFSRVIVWLWFIIYTLPTLALGWFWWQYRAWPAVNPQPLGRLRSILLIEAAVLGSYGLASIIAPNWATAFWPWKIDAFHAQIYSALFMTGAIGAWIVAGGGNRYELLTLGWSQVVLGLGVIAALAIVEFGPDNLSVPWASIGTIIWVASFGLIALVGGVLIGRGMRQRS
ncbi:MAG TPA: hypothetical protein DEF47_16130 [Herpetosiphon sp.]|uniref:Uncharacterized protein n=1 Tax=Herpetosiphon aurantiacus (strain ATCC 23779 / DSM 785 / 114-95) TaxID=316274 RepID=A9AZJ9_HERA2|nr:hypothetical protein [Herpetosiphon sp.]ABX05143.1 conserved hypothetical protein [Herpetosiphon aurantiacus DSM 785]HBW51423.1 hypothetical protein [Herpetosiphon sp.]